MDEASWCAVLFFMANAIYVASYAVTNMVVLRVLTVVENIIIGLPVVLQLHVYSYKLIEGNYTSLHGTECNSDGSETSTSGIIRKLVPARPNQLKKNDKFPSAKISSALPKLVHDKAPYDEDPLPHPILLEQIEK